MKENKQNRRVGISGVKMDNSSISNSTFVGDNSSADVGIFDTEMKDTHLSKLKISDSDPRALDSTNKIKSKSKLFQFWTLISENKLISGLLIIFIVWFLSTETIKDLLIKFFHYIKVLF